MTPQSVRWKVVKTSGGFAALRRADGAKFVKATVVVDPQQAITRAQTASAPSASAQSASTASA